MRHMFRALRSYLVAMKAVRRFGRASRLKEKGERTSALLEVREALSILRRPVINRASGPEGSALCGCTILAEELALELNQPGAEIVDCRDSLAFLKQLPENSHEFQAWVPHLESRIQ